MKTETPSQYQNTTPNNSKTPPSSQTNKIRRKAVHKHPRLVNLLLVAWNKMPRGSRGRGSPEVGRWRAASSRLCPRLCCGQRAQELVGPGVMARGVRGRPGHFDYFASFLHQAWCVQWHGHCSMPLWRGDVFSYRGPLRGANTKIGERIPW